MEIIDVMPGNFDYRISKNKRHPFFSVLMNHNFSSTPSPSRFYNLEINLSLTSLTPCPKKKPVKMGSVVSW